MVHKVNVIHETISITGWARRRQDRSEEILSGALRVVAREGFDGFTMQRLAEELGYVAGALYRYFPSKDALLAELQRRALATFETYFQRVDARCVARCAEAKLSPRAGALARILAAARVYRTLPEEAPEQFALLAYALGDPRELIAEREAAHVVGAAVPILQRISGMFIEAVEVGALSAGEPSKRAVVLWASLHGVLQIRKLARVEPVLLDPQPLAPELVMALLAGWGASSRDLERAARLVDADDEGEPWIAAAMGEKARARPQGRGRRP